jgi:hypothetical protein
MNIAELKKTHPMPWRYVALGGNIILTDASKKEVPLFTLLDFACTVSAGMAKAEPAPQTSS